MPHGERHEVHAAELRRRPAPRNVVGVDMGDDHRRFLPFDETTSDALLQGVGHNHRGRLMDYAYHAGLLATRSLLSCAPRDGKEADPSLGGRVGSPAPRW